MEKLIIFRIFLYFPFIGFTLPDAGVLLSQTPSVIPFAHLIIEAVLITFIILCSVRIAVLKKRDNHATEADKHSAFGL